jgi:hypothetical protein
MVSKSGNQKGGGYGTRQHREVRAPKAEPRPRAVHPGGVAQLGNKQGSHVTRGEDSSYRGDPFYRGKGYATPVGISDPVKAVGVGRGREVFKTGSQGMTGQPAPGNPPKVPDRHIIESYGPDYQRPGNPHRRSSDRDADF